VSSAAREVARPSLRFIFEDPGCETYVRRVLRRLPPMTGAPVRIQSAHGLRDRHGQVHAGSFPRERRIVFDRGLAEFRRVFVHELFHFVWLRMSNAARRSYEELVKPECLAGSLGELGWSAEWRKRALKPHDIETRSRRWREYCCESFCDSAAWLYSGIGRHEEFTLAARYRKRRQAWFAKTVEGGALSI
jgi:hypothetical protein